MNGLDPEIESLNLLAVARAAAYALKEQFPNVKFTSGRRSLADQARAMAQNVAIKRNWIRDTYRPGAACSACQAWVEANPAATSAAAIAAGLQATLTALPANDAMALSLHLTGRAFDILPAGDAAPIHAALRAMPGYVQFLEREGGLVRWHAEFA
jgi:hypothetical protein